MDHSNLAQRFNEATDVLSPIGHGVLVRRARMLLGEGDVAGVVAFLRDAARRQGLPVLGKLAGAVEDWQGNGGKASELQKFPAWKQGGERADSVSRRIEDVTGGAGLDDLINTLVDQQRTQAAVPQSAPPSDRMTGPQPLASIFPQVEKPAAVVEADSHLVSVPLNLDDEPAPKARPARGSEVRPPLPSMPVRGMGDRPTSAPPVPLTTPTTAPPKRQAANTASVPLPPEAVEEGPTMVTQPPFAEEDVVVEDIVPASALLKTPPPPPTDVVQAPATQVTSPGAGSGAAYWIAFGLLLVVAVLWLALR